MNEQQFPKGWHEQRMKRFIAELDAHKDEERIAADDGGDQAVIKLPAALLPGYPPARSAKTTLNVPGMSRMALS